MNSLTTEQQGDGFYIAQFKNSDLAIFSYYVESNNEAFVIDPTYDTTVYREMLDKRASTLKFVLMTHYHADYLAGHTELKVPIFMGEHAKRAVNGFELTERKDGESFTIGNITLVTHHTPGHTFESSCYELYDAQKKPICLFTGDTVFLGDVGRPDLAVAGQVTSEDLAHMLFDSIQKIKKLQPQLRIYPGHGSGSACGKSIGAGNFCDLKTQSQKNSKFLIEQKEEFAKSLLTGLNKPPQYFFYDAQSNQTGPQPHDDKFKAALIPLNIEEFSKAMEKATLIDTRTDIPDGLIPGSYWTPGKGPMTTWIAMTVTHEDPIVVVTEEGKHEETIERFLRIGFFNILGYNNFKISEFPGNKWQPKIYNGESSHEFANRLHLDVRNPPEHETTGVIENSILIPLPQLKNRAEELKDKQNLLVNCRTGQRARYAYSILANKGIQSCILVDNFVDLEGKGHKVVKI